MTTEAAGKVTAEWLMNLMRRLPAELMDEVRRVRDMAHEAQDVALRIQGDVETLSADVQALMERLAKVEASVCELCNVTNKVVAIKPLMDLLRDDEHDE